MSTKIDQFIADLDGGQFENKLSAILSEVAGAVVDHGKPGKVEISMDIKQVGNGYQVQIDHKLKFCRPTTRGKSSEEELTTTPMHVGKGGALSFFPENQAQMFGKTGENLKHPYPHDQK